jgi:probable HAF family extracellular repeat protein
VDLGTVGGLAGGAKAINAAGDIVGHSTTAAGVRHATLWSAGTGSVPPASTCKSGGNSRSKEKSRNEKNSRSDKRRVMFGPVTMVSAVMSSAAARVAQDLAPAGGASEASGINASGQIVGYAENSSWVTRAMVWKAASSPLPPPSGTPSGNHQGNHQNEGEEEGDC